MRQYEPIAGITVGPAGSDTTIPITANRRLLMADIYASATNAVPATVYGADVIDGIQVYVGTNLVWDTTAQELLDIAKANGMGTITPSATVPIPMFMAEPWRASVMDEQVSAWDLFGQPQVTIKCRTKAGLTAPAVVVIMDYDDGFTTNDRGERVLNIIKKEPVNLGSLGSVADITQANIPTDLPIQRIFIYPAAGVTIQGVQVKINESKVVFDLTQPQNIALLSRYGLLAEAGNGKMFPVVFDMNQQMFDGLPPVKSINLRIAQSGAGVVKLVLERRSTVYR